MNELDKQRYSRHLMLEEVGEEGQAKLAKAKVLIVGAGALGTPNALYLSGAGVGKIGIIDDDVVDVSNLHRQVMYRTQDIGKPKVECAKEAMLGINPNIEVQTYQTRLTYENVMELIKDYDFIIDATDNFVSKFLLNDACVLSNKPFAHAGIVRFMGQAMSVKPHQSACLGCLFETPPSDASIYKPGLFGTIPAILGGIQASEALKFFTGVGEMLYNRLANIEISTMQFRILHIKRNPKCQICGEKPISEVRKLVCH